MDTSKKEEEDELQLDVQCPCVSDVQYVHINFFNAKFCAQAKMFSASCWTSSKTCYIVNMPFVYGGDCVIWVAGLLSW